jgi:hypothetical protein
MPSSDASPPYRRDAIFDDDGPINPLFMQEAVRSLMRALPLDPDEPQAWAHRRMSSALDGLAALHPRDEIEVMLGVQSLCAYHAAATGWHLGMNHVQPAGGGLRHLSAAAAAARIFDTLLRALERRQARPLAVPAGRPAGRHWEAQDPGLRMRHWEDRCSLGGQDGAPRDGADPQVIWTPQAVAVAEALQQRERLAAENAGLDLANTAGILPGGGMIMPAEPTPQQEAYMARRLGLELKRQWAETLRQGGRTLPKIRPIKPGDLIA